MKERERLLEFLGKVDDLSTKLNAKIVSPIMRRRGIETVLTTTREERVQFLAEQFKGARKIRITVGPDPGELDEIAEALERAGLVPPSPEEENSP